MNLKQLIALFSLVLLLISCAQIVPLSGGEKDIEAPKEVESIPVNGALNFSENSIRIEFDEFIKLTNLSSQLIVSPLMDSPPEILIKGKKMVLKLKSELAPNTTYSINFGNAISDITENNIFPNYKYVFSTGSYLDSLSYSGSVVNAFDLIPVENVYVLLYDQLEDSVPLKELPRYVALTNKEGHFSITNIAHGKYKLFAINDINSNYLFDLPNESIAFKNEFIQLDSSSSDHLIYLFKEENELQYVDQFKHSDYGKVRLILNAPTKNLQLTPINKTFIEAMENWSTIEKNETGDSLILWLNPDLELDQLTLEIKDADEIIDTVDIILLERASLKDTLLAISSNLHTLFDLNQSIILTLKRPHRSFESRQIQLFEDSILIKPNQLDSIGIRKFELNYAFKEDINYQLFIPPGTFTDIYGLQNDTIDIHFKTKTEADYGTLVLNVLPNFSEKAIVQLFKGKKLVREHLFIGATKIEYNFLLPGDYSLKLIVDQNEDSQWNSGKYLEGLQPEKVIYYEKAIQIRANWDNDIRWTLNE